MSEFMLIYLFKRNKKTNRKTWIQSAYTEEEARSFCVENNKLDKLHFYEFTRDKEQLKNRLKIIKYK